MEEQSKTPLLDAIVAESAGALVIDELKAPSDEVEQLLTYYPPSRRAADSRCMWFPCTFILFGQDGETHDAYHERKGRC